MVKKQKPRAIIVGGSIAGISCAKALILAGWDVLVIEKTRGPPTANPTGAGLGLDPLSQKIIQTWLHQPDLLYKITLPLSINQNQATDGEKKISWVLARDENFNYRSTYWADLHGLIYNTLPTQIFLWGHQYLSFCISQDKTSVKVKAKVLQTDEIIQIEGDLLVAADGSRSSIRQSVLPHVKLRYAGYCAWRGVHKFSENDVSETILGIRKAYPDLGKCLYMELGSGSHIVLTELTKGKINWAWYVNQPEPELQGNTTAVKVSSVMIEVLHQRAEKVWLPELARVIKETREPFLNVVYDCDPLPQIFCDRVVLTGDAAHPTTPHSARSTNMAIIDAAVLGKCLEKWGTVYLQSALKEYQSIRLPVTSTQILHSRLVGRMKQALSIPGREPFDPKTAGPEDFQFLQNTNIPLVHDVPPILDSMFGRS
ncbi:zeaxanthin epoxidase, chloroplastic-like [Melia azedarach]|uniref:Zeaxanthin epoxidase, chloroplastic-like n=1 Tax=Melia azedarach TaxID=155640 RepID=A0ACC1X9M9_MELAZ|nr:zeaxanthin epoxidase, chloroplastic-like [Melia azedarach]